jgi:hypothetical protein
MKRLGKLPANMMSNACTLILRLLKLMRSNKWKQLKRCVTNYMYSLVKYRVHKWTQIQ